MKLRCDQEFQLASLYSTAIWILCKGQTNTLLRFVIRHFKHQKGIMYAALEITYQPSVCPVNHVCRYIRCRGSTSGPLFIFADNSPVTKSYFAWRIQATILYIINVTLSVRGRHNNCLQGFYRLANSTHEKVDVCDIPPIYSHPYDAVVSPPVCCN